jgi:hypothetical protein
MNFTDTINKICRDIILGVYEHNGEKMISSAMTYPDGDHILAYWNKYDGVYEFTDYGETIGRFRREGLTLSPSRNKHIALLQERFGFRYDDDAISLAIDEQHPGKSFLLFCEVTSLISSIEYSSSSDSSETFKNQVHEVLIRRLPNNNFIHRNWNDKILDNEKLWQVDFRIESESSQKHVFAVSSGARINFISAAEKFYRIENVRCPTLAVVNDDLALGRKETERLRQSSDRVIAGLNGNEEKLIDWIEAV